MSKIALSPNASGTGVFTIASPNGNTDRTLTLPDEAGTVLTSASGIPASQLTGVVAQKGVPAFSVYQSPAQSITANVWTKMTFQNEDFDVMITSYGIMRSDANLLKKRKWQAEWVFGIYNLYNRQNAASITFRQNDETASNEAIRLSIFGIVPSATYNIKF